MSLPTAAAPTEVRIAHCLLDADGAVLSAARAEEPFYAASTIKLHVLLAVLRAAEQGALDLDTELPATRTFTGADGEEFTLSGDHLDPTHPEPGTPIALRDLATRMIDRSSNEATDQLLELVGLDAVASVARELGLGATRVERLIGDAAALERGLTNETTAADLARTMHHLVAGPGLSGDSRELALAALRAQRIPVIATVLRDGVRWGSKSGWVDGYRHDVALVEDPAGSGPRLLAVMTAGLADQEADTRIVALARELLPGLTA
ncbi:serine hydrolase [Brachybacterium paraconglomeratum]|uniref:serine hydrolase n=1 Tax=Brachybacterium paraconglomeratum TaxID=173362 RepID=UPI0022E8391E|nr:serine hydrolase [Brachybacterium paraconglomeratum]